MNDSPILVDFLPQEALGLPGHLGLTIAPGRWRPGLEAAPARLVADDLEQIRHTYRADVLVTLLEEFEMQALAIPSLLAAAKRAGLESIWFPIRDVSIPRSVDETVALVERLLGKLRAGRTLVVHCLGGLGRSGTIAACCLTARGRSPWDAIAIVRKARDGAIQTSEQERFVVTFADAWGEANPA